MRVAIFALACIAAGLVICGAFILLGSAFEMREAGADVGMIVVAILAYVVIKAEWSWTDAIRCWLGACRQSITVESQHGTGGCCIRCRRTFGFARNSEIARSLWDHRDGAGYDGHPGPDWITHR